MTHVEETGAIIRLLFPAPDSGIRASCTSGTGFVWYQIPAPIRKLFYSKPESGMHVTEMTTCDWSMIIRYILMSFFSCCNLIIIFTNSSSTSLSAMFIFAAWNFHSICIRYEKPAPENRVDLWRRFLERLCHCHGYYSDCTLSLFGVRSKTGVTVEVTFSTSTSTPVWPGVKNALISSVLMSYPGLAFYVHLDSPHR